jgi:hypothetical protein
VRLDGFKERHFLASIQKLLDLECLIVNNASLRGKYFYLFHPNPSPRHLSTGTTFSFGILTLILLAWFSIKLGANIEVLTANCLTSLPFVLIWLSLTLFLKRIPALPALLSLFDVIWLLGKPTRQSISAAAHEISAFGNSSDNWLLSLNQPMIEWGVFSGVACVVCILLLAHQWRQ